MVQLHSKTMMFAESFGIGGEGMRTTDVVLPQVLANRLAIHSETQLKCLFSLLAGYLLKKGKVCTFFFFLKVQGYCLDYFFWHPKNS